MKFERSIDFQPAFDKRTNDPKTNCGIHGVTIRFVLKGEHGAYQFVIYTNWQLPHVQLEMDSKPLNEIPYMFHKPMAADVGYHACKPQYAGHKPTERHCDILGGECYYDGSSLYAEKVFDMLLGGGSEAVWKHLEELYSERFLSREATP